MWWMNNSLSRDPCDEYPRSFSRGTCHAYPHSLSRYTCNTHTHAFFRDTFNEYKNLSWRDAWHEYTNSFSDNQQMNTQIYFLVLNKRERENIGSTSKSVTQDYLCPISATSLVSTGPPHSTLPWSARHLRCVWHFYSPWQLWSAGQLLLSIFSLLDNLSRPDNFAWVGNFILQGRSGT